MGADGPALRAGRAGVAVARPRRFAAATVTRPIEQLRLERSRREGQGDYSTNAAMLLAPALKQPPRAVAERIAAELSRAAGRRP